eukprot:snap_masked-scaffold_1-processed-gene-17.20-mRNA-1 protein AED:1.00 eAED:1.00 QI:0/-1/0/0/-1/1/1/0/96
MVAILGWMDLHTLDVNSYSYNSGAAKPLNGIAPSRSLRCIDREINFTRVVIRESNRKVSNGSTEDNPVDVFMKSKRNRMFGLGENIMLKETKFLKL